MPYRDLLKDPSSTILQIMPSISSMAAAGLLWDKQDLRDLREFPVHKEFKEIRDRRDRSDLQELMGLTVP
jgi:hypothetical protein